MRLANNIKNVFQILSRYEDITIFGSKEKAQDLFKDLYLRIMPLKVRHSLGEFYTPTWLADCVVHGALELIENKKNWTGLDPCAGSGTFVNVMIQKVLVETQYMKDDNKRLDLLLERVKGLDLNPLAVLTARVNYFINISPLITRDRRIEIPVYLGDASYVPELVNIEGVVFYEYRIKTLKKELLINVPKSMVDNPVEFSRAMTKIETHIKRQDVVAINNALIQLVDDDERENPRVISCINRLAEDFVDLEKNQWNGIWARIVTNFLTAANMPRADVIVGNPPWIDWKTLPEGYRERIKGLCISRHLFSGDGITGGINLNICALISNVASQKWLTEDGVLAFLMPKPLPFSAVV